MKIKTVLAGSILDSAKEVIKRINHKEFVRHVVIVPDRFSLLAEKLVLSQLNTSAVINVDVMGLNSLCLEFLNTKQIRERMLGSLESLFITKKAIEQTPLKLYKNKNNLSFISEVNKTINQLKSSGIVPEDMVYLSNSKLLSLKTADIRNIYQKYEELKGDRLDPAGLLREFKDSIFQNHNIKNTKFYFVGFDSLTTLGFEVLFELSKHALEVTVGVTKPISPNNAHIFETDMFDKLNEISKIQNLSLELIYVNSKKDEIGSHMETNLFGKVSPLKIHSPFAYVTMAGSIKEEVLSVCRDIKYKVFNGARYKDFNIVIPGLKYKNIVENLFSEFDFCYHIDADLPLAESYFGRFALALISFAKERGSASAMFDLLDFGILGISEESFNVIKRIVKENRLFKFTEFENPADDVVLKNCLSFSDRMNASKTFEEWIGILLDFIKSFESAGHSYAQSLEEKGYLDEAGFVSASYKKSVELLEGFINSSVKLNLTDVEDFIRFIFSENKLDIIPESADSIFVGDAGISYFEERRHMYVLGASAEQLPKTVKDVGLLTDRDIAALKDSFNLEPSIKMINRRARFKLYNLLLNAVESLNISYVSTEGGKAVLPATIVNDVLEMFVDEAGEKFKPMKTSFMWQYGINEENLLERYLYNLGNYENASLAFFKSKNAKNQIVKKFNAGLLSLLKQNTEKLTPNLKTNFKNLALKNNTLKATQVESFYRCPHQHFLTHALKLKEIKTSELDAATYGSIMHKIAELYVKNPPKEIKAFLENTISAELERYKNLPKGCFEILMIDGEKLCADISREFEVSGFVPKLIEESFNQKLEFRKDDQKTTSKLEKNQEFIENSENYYLSGRVDRVDECESGFRIIDYKTGKKQNVLKELYYGEKIQLFAYSEFIERITNKKPVGLFYFNANYAFEDKRGMVLDGLYLKDSAVVENLDKTLNAEKLNSEVVPLKLKKKELVPYESSGFKIAESLKNCNRYALNLIGEFISEINAGNAGLCPSKDACKFCSYKTVCGFDDAIYGSRRLNDKKVSEESFKEENGI